jgi:alpha-ribazole phosphatase
VTNVHTLASAWAISADPEVPGDVTVWAWRHPRPLGAAGLCVGRVDLPVTARQAKRLARRIQTMARAYRLPHVVHTSPSKRCHAVGRWLRRWGWQHHVDPALMEMDFGRWDGARWADVPRADVDAWVAAFTTYPPGGGESLADMLRRCAAWAPRVTGDGPHLVVTHGGWMLCRRWVLQHGAATPTADAWPQAPSYSALWGLGPEAGRPRG